MSMLITSLALFGVAGLLVAAGIYIYLAGPGIVTRRVRCPEKRSMAKVTFVQEESGFGSLAVVDVTACSLLDNGPVTCSKACR